MINENPNPAPKRKRARPDPAVAVKLFEALTYPEYMKVKAAFIVPSPGRAGPLNFVRNGKDYSVYQGALYLGLQSDLLALFAEMENPPQSDPQAQLKLSPEIPKAKAASETTNTVTSEQVTISPPTTSKSPKLDQHNQQADQTHPPVDLATDLSGRAPCGMPGDAAQTANVGSAAMPSGRDLEPDVKSAGERRCTRPFWMWDVVFDCYFFRISITWEYPISRTNHSR